MKKYDISKQTLQRMPSYLNFLEHIKTSEEKYISAPVIARNLRLNEVQVRKDIAMVSTVSGKPKLGFEIDTLITDIKNFLGYDETDKAVLIGVGHLGRALLSYEGYAHYGLEIVAAFDVSSEVVGTEINKIRILDMNSLEDTVRKTNADIGIITVSAKSAQSVCDRLVECGIKAIWNFAPTYIEVPESILIQNENTAASLALLSLHLRDNKSRAIQK